MALLFLRGLQSISVFVNLQRLLELFPPVSYTHLVGDGTLEQAEAPQEAAYRLESGDYLYIQTSETGYDYTLYDPDYKELDGGQLDNPDLSLAEAGKEILAIHELPAGAMEPLTGDRLDDFLEAAEPVSYTHLDVYKRQERGLSR